MSDYEARATMLHVAAMWEAMAKNAESHSRGRSAFGGQPDRRV